MKEKQFRGRSAKGLVVLAVMILVSLLCGCTEKEAPEEKALQEAENWVKTNYEQIYEVRNLQSSLLRTEDTDEEMQYRILVQGETKYKYQSLDEIPFVKGMLDESKAQELTKEQQSAIDAYIEEIADGANIGNYNEFAIEIIVCADKEDPDVPHELFLENDGDMPEPIDNLRIDTDKLYQDGKLTAREILQATP